LVNLSGKTSDKFERLRSWLQSLPDLLVAYSGGVDSTFLLKVATDVLGDRAVGVIGVSPSLPRRELQEALNVARQFHFRVVTIKTRELEDENYRKNPVDRCYFCKKELFTEMIEYAHSNGYSVLADGTNADDVGDFRPGMQAAAELKIVSPLKEFGLTKREIRELSHQLELPTWNKPEMACLSSRIPTGMPINRHVLFRVEEAENFLWELGFRVLRVRHHEDLARIELGMEEFSKLNSPHIREQIDEFFKQLGYRFVTVDLKGYQKGSAARMNTRLVKKTNAD